MTGQSVHYIRDLSARDIELLTQLLSLGPGCSPSPEWLRDQAQLISTLPATLLKPSAILPRIAMALPFTSPRASLCSTHKSLNAHLIRRIFMSACAECSTNLARLVKNPLLPPLLSSFVKRLHKTNSLWMSPELYRVGFAALPEDSRYDRISTGCEACIISAIGGNEVILSDLRASMIGRKKKHRPSPRLLPLVEAWILWSGRSNAILQESDDLGRDIRHCRRQMQDARRQLARNISNSVVGNSPETESEALVDERSTELFEEKRGEENSGDEQNFEESIIDFYANLMSTNSLISDNQSIHPAFRGSMVFSNTTGTFHKAGPEPQGPRTAYSESFYSNSGVGPSSINTQQQGLEEGLPKNTQRLIEIREEQKKKRNVERVERHGVSKDQIE